MGFGSDWNWERRLGFDSVLNLEQNSVEKSVQYSVTRSVYYLEDYLVFCSVFR